MSVNRQAVWDALMDEEVLRRCIPGCEELVRLDDDSYRARVRAAIGPVKALFATDLKITNASPPERYRLEGEGKAGAIGFGKGFSDVELVEDNSGTILRYSSQFQVGGRLAQLGSRLVVGATRKIAEDFFDCLAQDIDQNAERVAAGEPVSSEPSAWIWVAVMAIVVIAAVMWLA